MSAREQGRRIIKEVEDYEAKFDLGQKLQPTGVAAGAGGPGAGIGAAEAFPARYLYPDDRDKKYALRRELNVGAGRPDPITDDEIDYLLDKTSAYETAEFHKWFQRLYKMDDSNPVMKKWGMELVPELWQMKEQSIEDNARLQTQLAKIKLRGVRSREDLMLMWAISKGAIDVPAGPIYAPQDPVFPVSRRGVFNPRHRAGEPGSFFADRRGASGFVEERAALQVQETLPPGYNTNAFANGAQYANWGPNNAGAPRIAAGQAAVGLL